MEMRDLYESDFGLWLLKTIEMLESNDIGNLDIANLIVEIRGMYASIRKEFKKELMEIISHILMWKYQPLYRSRVLIRKILDNRYNIKNILEESPSFKDQLLKLSKDIYKDAVDRAMDETRMSIDDFPKTFELTDYDILEKPYQ